MFFGKSREKPLSPRHSLLFSQMKKRREEASRVVTRPKKRFFSPTHGAKFPRRLKQILLMLFGCAVLIGLFYFFFLSENFKVKKIIYIDIRTSNDTMPHFASLVQPYLKQHFFLIPTAQLEQKILEKYKNEIEDIKLQRRLPGKLAVSYRTYPEALNLITRIDNLERKFLVNTKGLVISEDAENPELLYLRTELQEFPKRKTLILAPDLVGKIVRAYTLFTDKFGLRVPEVIYKKTVREIHLKTSRNFSVWIDLGQNIDRQLFKLKRSLPKLDIYHENLEYIDLRISGKAGDKVIFKKR